MKTCRRRNKDKPIDRKQARMAIISQYIQNNENLHPNAKEEHLDSIEWTNKASLNKVWEVKFTKFLQISNLVP